ncbi:MAG: amidohydrolase family protein [Chloroflexota bacterium]|nr:amidohydrolase family protein [Chloroflexota bacterium]
MADLVIKNGLVVTPQGLIEGGVAIEGGKILDVSGDASLPRAREVVDARGNWVLPGALDPHVHLGIGAGRGQGEAKFAGDFRTESISAAVGGITTIISSALFGGGAMKTLLPCIARAREIGGYESLVDFKFNAFMMSEAHLAEIPRLREEGVTSFKFLMAYKGEEGRQVGAPGIDWGFAYQGFEAIARLGPPALAMVHAEEADIIYRLRERLKAQGRGDLAAWNDSRPGICEAMHIFSAGLIAQEVGAPCYIVHVSARESVDALRYFKDRGTRVFGETCAHYLVLTGETDIGLVGKVNPPLREESDSQSLWQGLRDGTLDNIGSDHCAYQRSQKEEGGVWDSMPGFGGMAATLAILVSQGVHRGRLTLEQLARLTSENTARLFGLYPKKGVLAPGSDADIIIIDPNQEWTLGAASLKSASDFSVFEGMRVKGRVVKTFVRGKLVAQDGQPVAEAPWGRFAPAA